MLKKQILNLDTEDMAKFESLYGRTIGMSKAVRTLIAMHLKLIAKKKEALNQKDQLDERATPADITGASEN